MVKATKTYSSKAEELMAELAGATYRVALKHGFKGALIDYELDLWYAHRALLNATAALRPLADGAVGNAMPQEL